MVMRAPVGVTGRGSQHAQNMETFFLPLPGIKIVVPATAYDAVGLLRSAVRDDNPVLMFEHKLLYGSKGARAETGSVDASSEIPDDDYTVPIGKGVVRREGSDVTIVATLLMMHRALQAADLLAAEGISAEVIDPRSLVPFDWELLKGSVAKTGRVVMVEESPKRGGIGAEIAATLAEEMIDLLLAPVQPGGCAEHPGPVLAADGEVLRARREAHRGGRPRAGRDLVRPADPGTDRRRPCYPSTRTGPTRPEGSTGMARSSPLSPWAWTRVFVTSTTSSFSPASASRTSNR